MLKSFGEGMRIAVFGASGGIGAALIRALEQDPAVESLYAVSRDGHGGLKCDYSDEASLAATAACIAAEGPVHLVLVATGILHGDGIAPEKTWKTLDARAMADVFAVNTITPVMIAKHMLPLLARDRKSVFAALSARVGSISDNRLGGWISYRSSKAALNMALKTLSIELARTNPQAAVLGLHPGTVATDLSAPYRKNIPEKQVFTSEQAAQKLLTVIENAVPGQSGHVLTYDGSIVPA